jgi:hypothetical protein
MRETNFRIYQALIFLLFAAACTNVDRLDTAAVKSAIESHKIKKITEAELMTALTAMGDEVVEELEGIPCGARRSYADSVGKPDGFTISQIDAESYSGNVEKDRLMVEALWFELSSGKAIGPTPQKLNDSLFAYYFTTPCNDEIAPVQLWKLMVGRAALIQGMN